LCLLVNGKAAAQRGTSLINIRWLGEKGTLWSDLLKRPTGIGKAEWSRKAMGWDRSLV